MNDELLSIKTNNNYYLYHRTNRCFYISDVYVYKIFKMMKLKIPVSEILRDLSITHDLFIEKMNYIEECSKNEHNQLFLKKVSVSLDNVNRSIANIKQIIIEVTEKCNLNCYYCCYGKLYKNRKSDVNINEKKSFKALQEIIGLIKSPLNKSVYNKIVVTFYGGEPLINIEYIKKTIEYMESQSSQYLEFYYSMTTNGILLDKNIDYLNEKNIKINISLDGNKEENAYRVFKNGKNSYDKIWSNLDYIKSKYPVYYKENIKFISVLHDKNSLTSLHKYFSEKNKTFLYSTLHKTSEHNLELEKIYNSGYLSDQQLDNIKKEIPELYHKIASEIDNIDEYIKPSLLGGNIFRDKTAISVFPTSTCFLFQSKIFLTVSGLLLPCEKADFKFAFGYYNDNGLVFDLKKIEDQYNNMLNKFYSSCKNCYENINCQVCYFIEPESLAKNSTCYTNKKKFTNRITKVLNSNEYNIK